MCQDEVWGNEVKCNICSFTSYSLSTSYNVSSLVQVPIREQFGNIAYWFNFIQFVFSSSLFIILPTT